MKRLNKLWTDDSILINSHYDKNNDILMVVTKSAKTGKKDIHILNEPLVPVYVLKKELPANKYREHPHVDDLVLHWVPEKYRYYAIADILGVRNYAEKVKSGSMKVKDILLNKRIFGADKEIADLVMRSYVERFTIMNDKGLPVINTPRVDKFHIGALDIETDIKVNPGESDEDRRKQPINVITYIDNKNWKIKTIAVRNYKYQGFKEVEKDIEGFERDLKNTIRHQIETLDVGKESTNEKIKSILLPLVSKLSLDLSFTNSEAKMIRDINKYVFNEDNPDIMYIYNAQYDIKQQFLRAEELGVNFDNLFKFRDLPSSTQFNYRDSNFNPTDRFNTYNMINPTKILDQQQEYYHMRSTKNFSKYSLDATATRELGTSKLDYSKICNWIGDFPYVDYKSFLMYNIIDVLVMLFLDEITQDTFSLMYMRFNLVTEWDRVGKSSPRASNAFDFSSYLQGYITINSINNLLNGLPDNLKASLIKNEPGMEKVLENLNKAIYNVNCDSDKDKLPEAIVKGGVVTSPNLINQRIKNYKTYDGLKVKVYHKAGFSADLDATSHYPCSTIANNASKHTLYGTIHSVGDDVDNDIAIRASMSIINRNMSSIGNIFFGLPTMDELFYKYKGVSTEIVDKYGKYNVNKNDVVVDKFSKEAIEYIKWWRKCYSTNYKDMDKQAGAPDNNLFIFSDSTEFSFSYYGTKVIINSNVPTNTYINALGTGINCGDIVAKDSTLKSNYKHYVDYLIPSDDPEISVLVDEGELDPHTIEQISKAKYTSVDVTFGKYNLNMLNRLLFTDYKEDIKWSIYKIKDNNKCLMLRLFSTKDTKEFKVDVEQRIIFYDTTIER